MDGQQNNAGDIAEEAVELPEVVDAVQEKSPEKPEASDVKADPASKYKNDFETGKQKPLYVSLVIQPLLYLACTAVLIVGLGLLQQFGFISSGGGGSSHVSGEGGNTRYICPMMCTPPQSEPGRCPVCAMELVPATESGNADTQSVQIDPAARRVVNIQTAPVRSMAMSREIQAIGRLDYDEGALKTISAYVDGRIEKLYADYTGVVVKKDDHLALIYSPKLYSSQVELLLAMGAHNKSKRSTLLRVTASNQDLLESARERLIELGMTRSQIEELEKTKQANSRMHLCAPISGTVIEKYAVEGEYVKEGQPIYKLADLSTVWVMLELFPADAAAVQYGQRVEITIQSYPGQQFAGRVAFIDPEVDPKTRTVGVRVVIPNEKGLLKIGDYAKAKITVPIIGNGKGPLKIYDAELANKWISPRHPHIIADAPGKCPLCGVDLVPASDYGFTASPQSSDKTLVVPRDAVLMAGSNSVIYVETEPGRFEIRPVVLGPACGNDIVIMSGLKEGEKVAVRGNFLIDSQMQLAGNPSLIDPSRAIPLEQKNEFSEKELEAIASLPEAEQELIKAQKICPVTKMMLGSMGTPKKIDVNGKPIYICCMGCKKRLLDDPEKYLAVLESNGESQSDDAEDPAVQKALASLSKADRQLALKQGICPVAEMPLGSMGTPGKVDVNGKTVFICCEGCREDLLANPDKYLAVLENHSNRQSEKKSVDVPQLQVPSFDAPQLQVPSFDAPQLEVPVPQLNSTSQSASQEEQTKISRALEKLSASDRKLAEKQRICPVAEMPLGSMGTPIAVNVKGRKVFICCEGCREDLLANPVKYLAILPQQGSVK